MAAVVIPTETALPQPETEAERAVLKKQALKCGYSTVKTLPDGTTRPLTVAELRHNLRACTILEPAAETARDLEILPASVQEAYQSVAAYVLKQYGPDSKKKETPFFVESMREVGQELFIYWMDTRYPGIRELTIQNLKELYEDVLVSLRNAIALKSTPALITQLRNLARQVKQRHEELGIFLADAGNPEGYTFASLMSGYNKDVSEDETAQLWDPEATRFRKRYVELVSEIQRECNNDTDSITLKMTKESKNRETGIPPELFIRMSDKTCYDAAALVEYIQSGVSALNTSPDAYNRPGAKIWYTPEDLEQLLKHPAAKKAKLRAWIKKRGVSTLARQLGTTTIAFLNKTANVMQSRGPDFTAAATSVFTPEEMERWLEVQDDRSLEYELPDEILEAKANTIEERIKTKTNQTIKADAVYALVHQLDLLTPEQRNIIDTIEPGFVEDMSECQEGRECVMVAGRRVQVLTKRISEALRTS
jgi:hypothetical protein